MTQLAARRLRGFTAAELSAVAAIIAILAVIIVPIFRDRVDEARRVGTLDDMQGLAKALVLANADTAQYARLQDLDNGVNAQFPAIDITTEVPVGNALRSTPFSDPERAAFAQLWNGPYAAIQNSTDIGQIGAFPTSANLLSTNNGPIRYYGLTPEEDSDSYPVDHYGNPYIYFPPGQYSIDTTAPHPNESSFAGGVVYSFGPDGLPGNVIPTGAGSPDPLVNEFRREAGVLGSGDDLTYVF